MFLLLDLAHRMIVRYHPVFGHLYVPNQRLRIPNELGGFYAVTNSSGFRSDTEFICQRSNRPRLLVFGDSYTAGDNLSNRERFTDLLSEMLDVEVYNYGLSGSGIDQSLLIYRELAKDVAADLIVLCVNADSIQRIQVSHRKSIDRTTRRRVLVPKPYFTLCDGYLDLHHVPVPRERTQVDPSLEPKKGLLRSFASSGADLYRHDPRLHRVRQFVRHGRGARVKSQLYRLTRMQPYDDYKSPNTQGWRLTEAILRQFIAETAPTPVLIVPIPTSHFFRLGATPIFQPLFDQLEGNEGRTHVADVSTPLSRLPWSERKQLSFAYDSHFSPLGHRHVAELMAKAVVDRRLLGGWNGQTRQALSAPVRSRAGRRHDDRKYILGVSCFFHDSAACLIDNGEIVACAAEERFSRIKNDRSFPHQSVSYCLEEAGIHQDDLAALVYYDNASQTFERLLHTHIATVGTPGAEESWRRSVPGWLTHKLQWPRLFREYLKYDRLLLQTQHHRSHAASAFYPSPFERAAILTMDGVGEWATASIAVGHGAEIRMIEEMRFPCSLGLFYSAFTQFVGFKVNSGEYKMMGLAPYGVPRYKDAILEHVVDLKVDGSLELKLEYFDFLCHASMCSSKMATLFGGAARKPAARITQREMDIARSVQEVTEEAVLRMARYASKLTGEQNLCMAGGVALNCVANGRILREGPFSGLWIQPASGDAGGAIGAALDAYHTYFGQPRKPATGLSPQRGSFWGPGFSSDEISSFLETYGYPYESVDRGDRATRIAKLLEAGKVVGHFSGRMEFGPRALGARSILGDARNRDMQVTLNRKIKYRESFRPFAPSVLAECAGDYFELDGESPYMMLVAPVRKERRTAQAADGEDLLAIMRRPRSDIPAVTHVDYSARIQTVNADDHPEYRDVIRAFAERTGVAVIVNTSFNVRGEPIVCTPYDAYRCFMRTEMDVLVLGTAVLMKEKQPMWPEAKGHVEAPEAAPPAPKRLGRLERALVRAYHREFVPVASRPEVRADCEIVESCRERPTTWQPCEQPPTPQDLFELPAALDMAGANAHALTDAATKFWRAGCATDALRPVVAKLIRASLRLRVVQHPIAEEVSSSVYVMF